MTQNIAPAELAAARERLHYAAESALDEERTNCRARASDLRLVLDALRDARRQAFEEAAQACHRMMNRLAVEDRDEDGLTAVYHTEGSAAAENCATELRALAAKEQA